MNNMTDAKMQNADHSNERATENREGQASLANPSQEAGFTKNEAMAHQNFLYHCKICRHPQTRLARNYGLWKA